MGHEGCASSSSKPNDPSLPAADSEGKQSLWEQTINITRHSCLRLNEFIRSFLGKVFLGESKACGKTKRHRDPNRGSRMVGDKQRDAAHGQPLVKPFQSGLSKPQGAVNIQDLVWGYHRHTECLLGASRTYNSGVGKITQLDAGSEQEEDRQSVPREDMETPWLMGQGYALVLSGFRIYCTYSGTRKDQSTSAHSLGWRGARGALFMFLAPKGPDQTDPEAERE